MDLLFICSQAQESSVIGNVVLAMAAREQGKKVAILFTGEAVAGLSGGGFSWPALLKDRQTRITIAKAAGEQGIPVLSQRDKRQTDIGQLLQAAKDKGVVLLSCPMWSNLLGAQDKLPTYLSAISLSELLGTIQDAQRVVGSL